MRRADDPREGGREVECEEAKASRTERRQSQRARRSAADKSVRKQRDGDLGRALRTVYDDTLREDVPDDFLNLLGKLS